MNIFRAPLDLSCVCLAVALLFPATCQAQLTEASLKGTVVDSFGQVTARIHRDGEASRHRHVARHDDGSESGTFLLAGLPPGRLRCHRGGPGLPCSSRSRSFAWVSGQTVEMTIPLSVVTLEETVNVSGTAARVATATEGRLADSYSKAQIDELPLPQRDIFLITKMSAGATLIPGAANSTKLSSSPVVTVNGNRYRGNNYVLDGAMNSNPNNSGEPAIVPSLESVEEVQVQTANFASEFGRGNGAVINVQTKSGTNAMNGRAWEFHRDASLTSKNYFATRKADAAVQPVRRQSRRSRREEPAFFFGSYEATRNRSAARSRFRSKRRNSATTCSRRHPNSVAARLLNSVSRADPRPGTNGQKYLDQRT